MVKYTKNITIVYLLFVMYLVFYSQARCSRGVYTPDPKAPKALRSIDLKTKGLPANWKQEATPASAVRANLIGLDTTLLAVPTGVPDALKKVKRLEARSSVGEIDASILAVTMAAEQAHDRGNYKVRKTGMRSGGVPIYVNNRSSGYSSGYSSGHK